MNDVRDGDHRDDHHDDHHVDHHDDDHHDDHHHDHHDDQYDDHHEYHHDDHHNDHQDDHPLREFEITSTGETVWDLPTNGEVALEGEEEERVEGGEQKSTSRRQSLRKEDDAEPGVYFHDTLSGETTRELPKNGELVLQKGVTLDKRVSV